MHPSDLVILAGRPGMGKTALATKIAFGAAKALLAEARAKDPNARAAAQCGDFFVGNECGTVGHAPVGEEAQVSSDKIRKGEIHQKDFDRFVQVSREIAGLPIEIDDTPALTLSAMRTRAGG